VVFSGAGASAIATAEHYVRLGVTREHVTLVDSKGVIHAGRTDLNAQKKAFALNTAARTLTDALQGADVLVGLSVGGAVTKEMITGMSDRPIIFALAHPTPEIMPDEARAVKPHAIIATGRSDFVNQVNNVLGFPFIFRGALDAGARTISEEMKMAATRALADLAREEVPESVLNAYGVDRMHYGPEYLIPKPLDPRVLLWVAPAVAQAAADSGVARRPVDLVKYREALEARFGHGRALMRALTARATRTPQRIVFAEGHDPRILRACRVLVDENIARPIVLGDPLRIAQAAAKAEVDLDGISVADPSDDPASERYTERLWERRRRKGITMVSARHLVTEKLYFGSLMVAAGDADAMILGIEAYYPDKLYAPLQVLGTVPGEVALGVTILITDTGVFFIADNTVTEHPDARTLAQIASQTARFVRNMGIQPRVALISFSNFGSARTPDTQKMAEAVRILHETEPDLEVDGEMMAQTALNPELLQNYPFSRLKGQANVLIMPHLAAANVGSQLLKNLGGAETVGPIMLGIGMPCHVLRRDAGVQDVINMAVIAAVDALARKG
jgi:malate dehydrogenase (oxaloacetate-decarboxylating)(NADP+)